MLGFAIILLLIFAGTVPTGKASVITVPDDYPSIGEAIAHAASGDRIQIRKGTYTENITINKRLTLEGDSSILRGSITITARNVKISKMTVQDAVEGVKITAGGTILYSLTVKNCTYGIKVERNGGVSIRNCTVNACEYGLHSEDNTSTSVESTSFSNHNASAVYFQNVSNSSIVNSNISDSPTGIGISLSQFISISKSVITNCDIGINFKKSKGYIENNFLQDNITHIAATDMESTTINGNTIVRGKKGIYLQNSPNNTIHSNIIRNTNENAIRIMYESKNCKLYNNVLYGNKHGISVLSGCDNTKIVNNTLYENTENIWTHNSQDVLIQNNIIIGGDYAVYSQESTVEVSYNNFSPNPAPGYFTGVEQYEMEYNIFQNPRFLDAENENFRLDINSPCIDFGKTENAPGTDLEGKARPYGKGVDLGAYEVTAVQITVVANDIDYNLAEDFLSFLDMNNVRITRITAADFPEHQEDKILVILGGPDAYNGVGYIVQTALDANEIDLVREEGTSTMFIKTNVWEDEQLVLILAGTDRELTQQAGITNEEKVLSRLQEWF